MNRRKFITLLGGTSAAWPLAARAQQPERVRRIGVLMGYADSDPAARSFIAAFVRGLEELGWTDGRNVRIEYRWAVGDVEQMRTFAKELVALQPDVILANTTPVTLALHRATRTIPIVFAIVSDPVSEGLVASLSRPGGNITGFINMEASMGGKWLELLKEIAPGVKRAAIMFNPDTAPGRGSDFFGVVRSGGPVACGRADHGCCSQRCRHRAGHHGFCARAGAAAWSPRRTALSWFIARRSSR